jgi:hypothetical protein
LSVAEWQETVQSTVFWIISGGVFDADTSECRFVVCHPAASSR